MIFSDPTCDEGLCHWKQIIDTCNGDPCISTDTNSNAGSCTGPIAVLTTGPPPPPIPFADPSQPPGSPAQPCSKASDCSQPPPTCFKDSVVSYANPSCQAGACIWELDLSECGTACADGGVCAAP